MEEIKPNQEDAKETGAKKESPKKSKTQKTEKKPKQKGKKSNLVLLILGILMLIGGGVCVALPFVLPKEALPDLTFPKIPSKVAAEKIYSDLTGLELASAAEKTAPAFCIQTPNGNDGARPHAGLNEAGVVFEAIAEAGITRFAAIYQNPTAAVIGPIRSLRLYYLQWDTPFDCTIVHAGGADDAIAAVRSGGYKDMTENYVYMYRSNVGSRRWNNLFTNASHLKQFAADYGYTTSNINGFKRMTPEESKISRIDNTINEKLKITEAASGSTSLTTAKVSNIGVWFGYSATFNVNYTYDAATNTYNRVYENGEAHEVYKCPANDLGEVSPENSCELGQMSPSVVVAMIVEEHKAEDGYHESIAAVGSGEVYIFQNGIAIHGTWSKPSVGDQIKFTDENGKEVALAPGQTFVEAVPQYGGVEY